MSSTKRLGKLRHTHVLGIETKPGDSHTSAASLEDVVQLQRRAELAETDIKHRGRAVYYTHAH